MLEKLREFDRVAKLLEMPSSECLGILNVSADTYSDLRGGNMACVGTRQPELERRLSYALPLMRRLASNPPVPGFASAGQSATRS